MIQNFVQSRALIIESIMGAYCKEAQTHFKEHNLLDILMNSWGTFNADQTEYSYVQGCCTKMEQVPLHFVVGIDIP